MLAVKGPAATASARNEPMVGERKFRRRLDVAGEYRPVAWPSNDML